ncbi:phosphatidylinositol 4-kinase, putative [Plasmodium knowlesi strain H]|uniref:1-phosphatidylinositol 4-kinase n=2 Tax=Plasmodium knowlesi TaxID=5850 RepID=A0A679KYC0_PLAKH|nr:phosphatidylinositol 4-kinase, putative [Plasmodium knowlesi strain H]OTN67154.1 putative Phosphatidylinositol 4-kinase [Plasmodium knowlesi]CAA9988742.1 phosphatidylinositol 4-kinase, putative [Plasmodium knowlesi strain H]VVS78216.1 phosphatidylinositol 4-kinase, putative [Plasmodium knowlesi strain H]
MDNKTDHAEGQTSKEDADNVTEGADPSGQCATVAECDQREKCTSTPGESTSYRSLYKHNYKAHAYVDDFVCLRLKGRGGEVHDDRSSEEPKHCVDPFKGDSPMGGCTHDDSPDDRLGDKPVGEPSGNSVNLEEVPAPGRSNVGRGSVHRIDETSSPREDDQYVEVEKRMEDRQPDEGTYSKTGAQHSNQNNEEKRENSNLCIHADDNYTLQGNHRSDNHMKEENSPHESNHPSEDMPSWEVHKMQEKDQPAEKQKKIKIIEMFKMKLENKEMNRSRHFCDDVYGSRHDGQVHHPGSSCYDDERVGEHDDEHDGKRDDDHSGVDSPSTSSNRRTQIRESISRIFSESPSSKPKIINEIKCSDSHVGEGDDGGGSHHGGSSNDRESHHGNSSNDRDKADNKANGAKSALKEGSLLRLFRCEYFDTHLHIRYLYDRREVGVHEYLVNSLYTQRKYEDILFYLPQLSLISLVRYDSSSLYRFLLYKASKSMHFALKLSWIYHSIVEDNTSKYKDLAHKMTQEIEMAVVNCKPFNSKCTSGNENKQSYLLNLAHPLLFKRKYIIKRIKDNARFRQNRLFKNCLQRPCNSYLLKGSEPEGQGKVEPGGQSKVEPEGQGKVEPGGQSKVETVGQGKVKMASPKKCRKRETTSTAPPPKLPHCYIINSGALSIARAKVKLPSTYAKLGNPLSASKFFLPEFSCSFDMIEDLQQFFMKQRRCDYFSLLNNFVNLTISVSNLLSTEPDIEIRNELLNRFIYSLNSWMLMRRCIVAACTNVFSMTGLCIPLECLSSSSHLNHRREQRTNKCSSLQILHFNYDECKIFFSKKRAPYLLMFEVADLDEDISHIPDNLFYPTRGENQPDRETSHSGVKGPIDGTGGETTDSATRHISDSVTGTVTHTMNDEVPLDESTLQPQPQPRRKGHRIEKNFCSSKNYGIFNENSSSYDYEPRSSMYDGKRKKKKKKKKKKKSESGEGEEEEDKGQTDQSNSDVEQGNDVLKESNNMGKDKVKGKKTHANLDDLKMEHLYVYNCIVNDLRKENLISFPSVEEDNLSIIRKCIGMKVDEDDEEDNEENGEEDDDGDVENDGESSVECASGHVEQVNPEPTNLQQASPNLSITPTEEGIGEGAKNFLVTPRSASMPNYLSSSMEKCNISSNDNDSNEIKTSVESISSELSGLSPGGLYENKMGAEDGECNLSRGKDPDDGHIAAQPSDPSLVTTHTRNSLHSSGEKTIDPLDISEYFKPENYTNEEFKKKNCRIIKRLLWGELFEEKKKKIRKTSPYGKLKTWDLKCVIVKGGDDLRQELLASQLIRQFKVIFENAGLPLWLRPYEILVTGANSGIIEYVNDTCSVDSLKRKFGVESISTIFNVVFADYIFEAKKNFIESHAAYSLISYLLQVKDRHNGNLLLDSDGHLIHIDYGFMLTNSPGNVNFETSPFKLTQEYLDIMDGEKSENYEYFRRLIVSGFLEARKHSEEIILFVELMMPALKIPCFANGTQFCIDSLKERFMTNLAVDVCIQRINALIESSINNFRSVQYDYFQRITNGIM